MALTPNDYPIAMRLLYDWQALAAALFALLAAFVAAVPVWRQLKLVKVQAEVNSRETLLMRASSIERRRENTRQKLRPITNEFLILVHQDESDDSPPEINSEWAFSAQQTADEVAGFLMRQQEISLDGEVVDEKRDNLINTIKGLSDCLDKIHTPYSRDLEGPDYNFTKEQISEIRKESKQAKKVLEGAIFAVGKSEDELESAFAAILSQIRDRIRQIDAFLIRQKG